MKNNRVLANSKGRNSDLEKEERVLYLLELRSKGVKGTSDLLRFFAEKWPEISKRQFEYDLAEAKELIKEYNETDIEFQVSEIVKHYWELYSKNYKIQDYRECRNIIKDLAALKGLVVQKVDHTTLGKSLKYDFSNMTLEEKKALLELIKKTKIDSEL